MKEFVSEIKVEWAHCDLAGIVFYPNFYIWFDQGTERLFGANGLSYAQLGKAAAARRDIDKALALSSDDVRQQLAVNSCSELVRQGNAALALRYCRLRVRNACRSNVSSCSVAPKPSTITSKSSYT